jgi:2-C-methyl-D-erythritol 4-phosphate cytidylyltransferase
VGKDRDVTAQRLRGDVAVLVPAAGAGVRLGPGIPKALRELAGEPLLVHAVRRLVVAPSVGQIVVAAPAGEVEAVCEMLATAWVSASGAARVEVVAGGASRQASVAAALAAADPRFGIVLVHDAARALAPPELAERVAAAVRDGLPAVIPVLAVVDTIKQVDEAGQVVGTVDRAVLRAVQTPQGFRRDVLVAAHAAAVDEHTDDAGLAEKLGIQIHTVPGDEAAMKITTPLDLQIAAALL